MNRSVSLTEHHARRRKAHAAREKEERNRIQKRRSQSLHSSSTEAEQSARDDGHDDCYGIAHDAASFGAYDAPSTPGEHASYAAERCIGPYHEAVSPMPPSSSSSRGIVSPPPTCFSSPEMDMEGQCARYYRVRRREGCDDDVPRTERFSNRLSCSAGGGGIVAEGGGGNSVDSCASSETTLVSVGVVEEDGHGSMRSLDACSTTVRGRIPRQVDEEDAIRAGIVDISVFVATYLAGALSFVVGIFLAILSPFIKLIKIIFGDLTGLIGDAFGLALRNNPGLWRDLEGLRRIFKSFSTSRSSRKNWNGSGHNTRRRSDDNHLFAGSEMDCEASYGGESQYTHDSQYSSSYWDGPSVMGSEGDSSYATQLSGHETAAQYVGGWSPSIISAVSSRGSNAYHHSSPLQHRQGMHTSSSVGRHMMQTTRGGMGTNHDHPIPHHSTSLTPTTRSRISSKSYSSLPQVNEDDASSCPPSVFTPASSSITYYPEDDCSVATSLSASSYNRERESRRRLMQRPRVLSRGSTRRGSGHFL